MGLSRFLSRRFSSSNKHSRSSSSMAVHESCERSRWSSLKVYLCGDEPSSLLAEDDIGSSARDSAAVVDIRPLEASTSHIDSARSSEATVVQPLNSVEPRLDVQEGGIGAEILIREWQQEEEEEASGHVRRRREGGDDAAAISIQSAFKGYLARKQYTRLVIKRKESSAQLEHYQEGESESLISEGFSTEVHKGGSVDEDRSLVAAGESCAILSRALRRSSTTQMQDMRLIKEEWDDSILSSNISKLRIQKRLEAMTRRERALAYAFSQQLRTCASKKRKAASYRSNADTGRPEDDQYSSGKGWSWLERWMATRTLPAAAGGDRVVDAVAADHHHDNHHPAAVKQLISAAEPININYATSCYQLEEKESCGSNDVLSAASINIGGCRIQAAAAAAGAGRSPRGAAPRISGGGARPSCRSRLKATRNTEPTRKTLLHYHPISRPPRKPSKKACLRETKDK